MNVQRGSFHRVGSNPLISNKRECFIENPAKKTKKKKIESPPKLRALNILVEHGTIGLYTMMVKPMKTLGLFYSMTQFLTII